MSGDTKPYGRLCTLFYDITRPWASDEEIVFYRSYLDAHPGRVLEAMCGSGRLLLPLLKAGYTVDGVDNSEHMLASCRDRLTELRLSCDLYAQPLEQLDLPQRYAVIIVAVGSFQLIADPAAALEALKRLRVHLQPGGVLLIDMFTPHLDDGDVSTTTVSLTDTCQLRSTRRYTVDAATQYIEAHCTYELLVDGVVVRVEQELLPITWYTDDQLHTLLQAAGLHAAILRDEQFPGYEVSRIAEARVSVVE